jgi:hypothetical protein
MTLDLIKAAAPQMELSAVGSVSTARVQEMRDCDWAG